MNFKSTYFYLATLGAVALTAFDLAIHTPRPKQLPIVAHAREEGLNKFERAQQATVFVKVTESGGGGSGFITKAGDKLFVWTAAHVVSKVNTAEISQVIRHQGRKVGLTSFKATVIARDAQSDLAVLFLDAPTNAFRISSFSGTKLARVGAPVYHVGNFRGLWFDGSASEGIVSQVGVSIDGLGWPWRTTDQANITATFGSSGGPLFDVEGKILGVVVGGCPIPDIMFFVPVREIERFAKLHNVGFAFRGDTNFPTDETLELLAKGAAVPQE